MTDPIRDALTHLIREIDLLAAASEGVSGLDMNGGLEPWSSLLEGGKSSIWLGDAIAAGRAALADQPPAHAASSTLDLNALLSPEGAYRLGTGQEDGAQLVSGPHGPERWAPLYGRDTLDNLLYQLCARILPYLRPPVAGIDVPGCDGDYGDVMDLCAAEGVDPRVGVPLLKRAQQAWKVAAHPPAPYVRPLAIEAGDAQQDYRSWLTYFEVGGNCGGGAKLSQENCRSLAALLRSLSHTLLRQSAPSLDAESLQEVWIKAWETGPPDCKKSGWTAWAALSDYVALAVEAQRAPSGNPPATEEYLAEARQEVAGLSPDLLARRLRNLARVQARDGRECSSALCARAAELHSPASDGERDQLASQLEDLADTFDQGTPEERALERSAALLRQPAPAAVPVPVAERPWERDGWCDADGRCWWSHGPTPTARWSLLPMDGMDDARGWLLPHSAIPIPQPPLGGEVA